MPIDYLEDWEKRLDRQDAFWAGEVIDRPVVNLTTGCSNDNYPKPTEKKWDTLGERWWDTDYIVENALHSVMNQKYYGDSLPKFMPNLGPEIFSGFFGTELHYGESTAWSEPNLLDWEDVNNIQFSWDKKHLKKIEEMTDALLEAGRGKFYTGITDLHPGGDAVAAFRDPSRLAMDMIECPDRVKNLLDYVTDVFYDVYDHFAGRLLQAGQAITTWAVMVSRKKWYIPGNDFSCMISNDMFRDIFLPGIEAECQHLEASIYHLDGPDALRHLDSLLEIDELNAIQWVFGAGSGPASKWMEVYKKCQEAGKGIEINMAPGELDLFFDELKPEGVWANIGRVPDEDTAMAIIKKLRTWT